MKIVAQNVAKALFAVDAALFAGTGTEHEKPLRDARLILSKTLTATGYEFAVCDSPRVKRRKG